MLLILIIVFLGVILLNKIDKLFCVLYGVLRGWMILKFLIFLFLLFLCNVLLVIVILFGCNVLFFFINLLIIVGMLLVLCILCIEYDELGVIFDKYGVCLVIVLMCFKL